MSKNELQKIKNFKIISKHVTVIYPSFTDISYVNFGECVFFDDQNVEIYPDKKTKPSFGEKLNKRAIIEYRNPPKALWDKFKKQEIDHDYVRK